MREAIAECQGQRNPNANTCIKLAAFYTILNEVTKNKAEDVPTYSYSPPPVYLDSDTEFAQMAAKMDTAVVLNIMDELMTALEVLNPRLYAATLRKMGEQ